MTQRRQVGVNTPVCDVQGLCALLLIRSPLSHDELGHPPLLPILPDLKYWYLCH